MTKFLPHLWSYIYLYIIKQIPYWPNRNICHYMQSNLTGKRKNDNVVHVLRRLLQFMAEQNCPFPVQGLAASFFFGVYSWLVKVLGQFSIIYFRGLGLRIGVRVWVRVRVGVRVWVRVRVRVMVRVSVVLWSG